MRLTQLDQLSSALTGIGLMALLGLSPVTTAFAQGPGGPPPEGFGGSQTGGPGGQGGFSVASGTVTSVDANAGTLTITTQGGGSRRINTDSASRIVRRTATAVSDLKVGDRVSVQGVPTGISVSQLTTGQPPAGLPGAGGFGGPRGGRNGNGGGGDGGDTVSVVSAFAAASGTVEALPTKTDPHLILTLRPGAALAVKVAAGFQITKYASVQISDVKSGDRILAAGQMGADGALTASVVGVNVPPGESGGG